MTNTVKNIYFVRHGEAAGNAESFSQTHSTPLTEEGHNQAKLVAKRFSTLPVDVVFASTMDRAQDTAKYIADVKGLTVEAVDYFYEFTKPRSIQGKSHDSHEYQEYEKLLRSRYTDPTWRFEDGENFSDVLTRVSSGVSMLEHRPEQNIVLVSHGRLLRFITSYLLHNKQLDATTEYTTACSMSASNTGITKFNYSGRWNLISWNDIAHFADW